MKTTIKTTIATLALFVVIGYAISAKASALAEGGTTILNEVKKVNQITVAGNVALILVQSADEYVKVYNEYYTKNALVQQKENELRISSFDKEPLTVVVYLSNLSTITASNQATVKTFGKLNLLSLTINLKDNASANLNTNTIDLYTNLTDKAQLSLCGNTTAYNATINDFSTVNMEHFLAETTNIQSKTTFVAKIKMPSETMVEHDFFSL